MEYKSAMSEEREADVHGRPDVRRSGNIWHFRADDGDVYLPARDIVLRLREDSVAAVKHEVNADSVALAEKSDVFVFGEQSAGILARSIDGFDAARDVGFVGSFGKPEQRGIIVVSRKEIGRHADIQTGDIVKIFVHIQ